MKILLLVYLVAVLGLPGQVSYAVEEVQHILRFRPPLVEDQFVGELKILVVPKNGLLHVQEILLSFGDDSMKVSEKDLEGLVLSSFDDVYVLKDSSVQGKQVSVVRIKKSSTKESENFSNFYFSKKQYLFRKDTVKSK